MKLFGKGEGMNYFGSILSESNSIREMVICIAVAMVLGLATSLVFSIKSRQTATFSLALALLPAMICVVIMMVNGNIGAGVAVAGAFALVRFRSIPGNAREITAVFFTMAQGLILGMGYLGLACVFFLMIAAFYLIIMFALKGHVNGIERLVRITLPENINYDGLFDDIFKKYKVDVVLSRVRTVNMGTLFELTYMAKFKDGKIKKEFIDEIRAKNGNLNVIITVDTDREVL